MTLNLYLILGTLQLVDILNYALCDFSVTGQHQNGTSELFHRHGFGKIARLVHVGAALQGGVIGQELHRDGMHDG